MRKARTAGKLSAQYASRLALAYVLSVTAAVAIVIPLGGEALTGAQTYFTRSNIIGSAVLVVVGTLAIWIGGVLNIADAEMVQPRPRTK